MGNLAPEPRLIAYYQQLLFEHGPSPAGVGWPKLDRAWRRYAALINSWIGHTESVLDYGCGLGHLGYWMHAVQGRQASYHGVDACAEMIEFAKQHAADMAGKQKSDYHQITPASFSLVEHAGALPLTRPYDHIVCCGVFNFMPGDRKRHQLHISETLWNLHQRCNTALHVDFLAPDVDFREPHLWYQSIHDLVNVLKGMSLRYVIDRGYLPWEFCVHIRRADAINADKGIYEK